MSNTRKELPVSFSLHSRALLKVAAVVALFCGTLAAGSRPTPAFNPRITIFQAIPGGSGIGGVVWAPDGNMWYTQCASVVRMSPDGARQTAFPIPSHTCAYDIVRGPGRTLWFDEDNGLVGKITLDGAVTEYALPEPSVVSGIAEGPDESLWLGTWYEGIIRISTTGKATTYDDGDPDLIDAIAFGPGGNLWFSEHQTGELGYMRPDHTIVEHNFASSNFPVSSLTVGPDHNMWLCYPNGRYTTIVRYEQRTSHSKSWFFGDGECNVIVSGDDRALYFTYIGSAIGRITMSGHHDFVKLPSGFYPRSITRGPDGSIWFTDPYNPRLGRLDP
jgi:virginiamycin B lyase